jgi:hypothetical protein
MDESDQLIREQREKIISLDTDLKAERKSHAATKASLTRERNAHTVTRAENEELRRAAMPFVSAFLPWPPCEECGQFVIPGPEPCTNCGYATK